MRAITSSSPLPSTRRPSRWAAHRARGLGVIVCAGALLGTACSSIESSSMEASTGSQPVELAFEDGDAPVAEDTAPRTGGPLVGILMQNTSRTFFQGLETGARARAADLGVELLVHDAEDDADAQLEGARELLAAGVEAIALSPVDSGQAVEIVELAQAAGVPIVSVANQVGRAEEVGPQFVYPGTLALVTNDDVDMGRKAAAFVAQLVGDDAVSIGIIEGKRGTSNVVMRRDGFADELEALAIDYSIAASAPGDWTGEGGFGVCADFAALGDIDLIFSMSDAMTAGCAEALDAAGRTDIDVVSIGGNADGIALLKAGAVVGTVCQKPGTMGGMAVELLAESLETETPIVGLRFYETPVVTVENQESACDPQW